MEDLILEGLRLGVELGSTKRMFRQTPKHLHLRSRPKALIERQQRPRVLQTIPNQLQFVGSFDPTHLELKSRSGLELPTVQVESVATLFEV